MLHDHHLIPQHQSYKLYLLSMELLVQYPKPLLNLLPNRSQSQMLFLIVLPRIHLALVKPQRSTLSSLLQWKKSSKGKKKVKGKGKADVLKQGAPKSSAGESSQQKPKHTCLICKEDQNTKDCP